MLRRSRLPRLVLGPLSRLNYPLDRVMSVFGLADRPLRSPEVRQRTGDVIFAIVVGAVIAYGSYRVIVYIHNGVGLSEVGHALLLGLATFARVLTVVIVATLIWVPVGYGSA